jgi:hypothetical protein
VSEATRVARLSRARHGSSRQVDALVLPELEARADSVDLEAALIELHDAQAAFAKADRELDRSDAAPRARER